MNRLISIKFLIVIVLISFLFGCITTPKIIGTPASGSKFSKLQLGMGIKQVFDLIGKPNDSSTHMASNHNIFTKHVTQQDLFYKNEGTLSFADVLHDGVVKNTLITIKVDPNTTGYDTGYKDSLF